MAALAELLTAGLHGAAPLLHLQMESKADFTEAMGGLQQQTGAAAAAQTALEIQAAPLKALNSDLNSVLAASRRIAAEILEVSWAATEPVL